MMKNEFSTITSIYDSALDDHRWDKALDQCVEFVGARTGTLFVIQSDPQLSMRIGKSSHLLRQAGDEFIELYNNNLLGYIEDWWERVLSLPIHTLVTDQDLRDQNDEEIVKSESYAFLLEQMGILRRVSARLNEDNPRSDNIAFQFEKSITVVPTASKESISILLPHIAKTIELSRVFNLLQSQYKAVLAALDFVEIGICIALQNGTVVVNNAESERIFNSDDGLKMDKNRMIRISNSPNSESVLGKAIFDLAATASGENHATHTTLAVSRRSASHPYLLEVSPLRDTTNEIGSSLTGALIMIIDPENSHIIQTERLSNAYGLSSAESTIIRYVIDGWTNSNIAEERGVSINTVKRQIANIMRKTQTIKRCELIRLALKSSPPVKSKELDPMAVDEQRHEKTV